MMSSIVLLVKNFKCSTMSTQMGLCNSTHGHNTGVSLGSGDFLSTCQISSSPFQFICCSSCSCELDCHLIFQRMGGLPSECHLMGMFLASCHFSADLFIL